MTLLPRSGWFFWLDEANFQPFRGTVYQATSDTEARSEWAPWRLSICPLTGRQTAWKADCEGSQETHALVTGGAEVKERYRPFVVIFGRVLRMTGTLSGAIQSPTSTALTGELGLGKLCWTVTTMPPLAGDWHGRISDDLGNMLKRPPGRVRINTPGRCWLKGWNLVVD